MRKSFIKYTLLLVVIIAVVWLLKDKWLPSVANIFKAKPVVIDDTPILIKQINELAQMCTITAFDEVVADSVEIRSKSLVESLLPDLSSFGTLPITGRRIVIIGKGKVVAGTDLKKLHQQSVFVLGDSVSITLPPAEILDAIINPSGFETFSEMGEWSTAAVTAVKVKARNRMIERALKQHILEKANERSVMLMENFLRTAGFKKVVVRM